MKLKSTLTNRSGKILSVIYSEKDPLIGLEGKILQGVHAFCFWGNHMVLVHHPKSGWMPPGGGIERNENYIEATLREVKEETNMKVTYLKTIGFQDTYEPGKVVRQVRNFCLVEPCGDFTSDPDGEIMEIKLIRPEDYKQYFDWGEIGDRIMTQALKYKSKIAGIL